jgi:hypothetical protein
MLEPVGDGYHAVPKGQGQFPALQEASITLDQVTGLLERKE